MQQRAEGLGGGLWPRASIGPVYTGGYPIKGFFVKDNYGRGDAGGSQPRSFIGDVHEHPLATEHTTVAWANERASQTSTAVIISSVPPANFKDKMLQAINLIKNAAFRPFAEQHMHRPVNMSLSTIGRSCAIINATRSLSRAVCGYRKPHSNQSNVCMGCL